jgi:hypothetical protein
MTLYQWGEDDLFDLQRMAGQKRPIHTPERKDPTIHTIDHPFCYDPLCSCHSNQEALQRVQQWIEEGLLMEGEATEYIAGHTF